MEWVTAIQTDLQFFVTISCTPDEKTIAQATTTQHLRCLPTVTASACILQQCLYTTTRFTLSTRRYLLRRDGHSEAMGDLEEGTSSVYMLMSVWEQSEELADVRQTAIGRCGHYTSSLTGERRTLGLRTFLLPIFRTFWRVLIEGQLCRRWRNNYSSES